jgi:hypothetical protein
LQTLNITAPNYVLNSSATLGVSSSGKDTLLAIKSPRIRNERYYSSLLMEAFSDYNEVVDQNNGQTTIVKNWAEGVQSRYGFYSPPGYIYAFSSTQLDFNEDTVMAEKGMVNNLSYFDIYSDLTVFGKGNFTTRGMGLEKLAYDAKQSTHVKFDECIYISHVPYPICSRDSSSRKSTPEGDLLLLSPENTLFGVQGKVYARNSFFDAKNTQSLTLLREAAIANTILKEKARLERGPWDSRCNVNKTDKIKDNYLIITTTISHNDTQIHCTPPGYLGTENRYTFTQNFNITQLVKDQVPDNVSLLNQQITDFESWWKVAQ